jgi:hypothetical protein
MQAQALDIPESSPRITFSLQGWQESQGYAPLAVLFVLWMAHVAATWDEASVFWGDYGRWLHELERFAHGEVLYRDFYWPFPPLALWVLGSLGRVFGSDLGSVRVITVTLSLLIYVEFSFYLRALLPRSLAVGAAVACFLLSAAYAQIASQPLPAGMYAPATPLGFLFLLAAVLAMFRVWRFSRRLDAATLGVLCGLCILTKQDYWLPALYLVGVSCWLWVRSRERDGRFLAFGTAAGFVITVAAGATAVGLTAGWKIVPGIVGGFGQPTEFAGRLLPSWERLTVEFASLSALGLFLLLALLAAGAVRWREVQNWVWGGILTLAATSSLHLLMSQWVGHGVRGRRVPELSTPAQAYLSAHVATNTQLFLRSLSWLKHEMQMHLFPVLLPACVILLVLAYGKGEGNRVRRSALLVLLGLCLACRARRLFEYVEWYQLILEIPVYLAVIQFLFVGARAATEKSLRVVLVTLVLLGGYSYWTLGAGAFTRKGRGQLVFTPRGVLRLHGNQPRYYRELGRILNGIDPSGQRPLFAFGYIGGFDYFYKRRNPSPLTYDFRFSCFDAEKVLLDLQTHTPGLILIDNSILSRIPVASPKIAFFQWETPTQANPFATFDRPLFARLAARCKEVAGVRRGRADSFTVYDCGP